MSKDSSRESLLNTLFIKIILQLFIKAMIFISSLILYSKKYSKSPDFVTNSSVRLLETHRFLAMQMLTGSQAS
jgi:hypothetical protein